MKEIIKVTLKFLLRSRRLEYSRVISKNKHKLPEKEIQNMDMLWFKFILGLKVFKLVSILFAIVPDYGNEYMTKENTN